MKKWLLLTLALAALVVPTLAPQELGYVDENSSSVVDVKKQDKDEEVREGTENEGIILMSESFE